jgi:hypothetical protein
VRADSVRIYKVEYYDLDELIYGLYDGVTREQFTVAEGQRNDTVLHVYLDPDDCEWECRCVSDYFNDGSYYPDMLYFLHDLCALGILSPGDYLINISW